MVQCSLRENVKLMYSVLRWVVVGMLWHQWIPMQFFSLPEGGTAGLTFALALVTLVSEK